MSSKLFNIRPVGGEPLQNAIVAFDAQNVDINGNLWMLYLLARYPENYIKKYSAERRSDLESAYQLIGTLEQRSMQAAVHCAEIVLSDSILDKIAANITAAISANLPKQFEEIRIAVPFPLDQKMTSNNFPPAIAAALAEKLAAKLNLSIPIIAELENPNEKTILNIANNNRVGISYAPEGKELETYMQRVFRQPVFSGEVNPNALYVPVDDFLVSQSTLGSLVSYIQSQGGVTVPPFAGMMRFEGAEIIALQQESLDYINKVIGDIPPGQLASSGGLTGFKQTLGNIVANVGLTIDFDNLQDNSLTNAEALFVAGFFTDKGNPQHMEMLDKALVAIGSSQEAIKGTSAHIIAHERVGTLLELKEILATALDARTLMADTEHASRFQNLVRTGKVLNPQELSI